MSGLNRLTLSERAGIALWFFPVVYVALLAIVACAGKPVNWRRL